MVAIVNDTVGIMMDCKCGTKSCEVGLIVGEPRVIHEGWWLLGGQGSDGGLPCQTLAPMHVTWRRHGM